MNRTLLASLVVLTVTLGLAPGTAEARFGKANTPGVEEKSGGKRRGLEKQAKKRPAAPAQRSRSAHAARPVRRASAPRPSNVHASSHPGMGHAPQVVTAPPPHRSAYARTTVQVWGEPSHHHHHGHTHAHVYAEPAPVRRRVERVQRVERRGDDGGGRAFVGAQVQAVADGAALGARAHFEGERLGFNLEVSGLAVRTDDGSYGVDTLQMLDLHLTYALVSTRYARLRMHVGADTVFAQDLTVMGPSGGASLDIGRTGLFGVEASLQVTPFPYRQVDSHLGASLELGAAALRAGWRVTWLDDAGLVDGVRHTDTFAGPYVGVGLNF